MLYLCVPSLSDHVHNVVQCENRQTYIDEHLWLWYRGIVWNVVRMLLGLLAFDSSSYSRSLEKFVFVQMIPDWKKMCSKTKDGFHIGLPQEVFLSSSNCSFCPLVDQSFSRSSTLTSYTYLRSVLIFYTYQYLRSTNFLSMIHHWGVWSSGLWPSHVKPLWCCEAYHQNPLVLHTCHSPLEDEIILFRPMFCIFALCHLKDSFPSVSRPTTMYSARFISRKILDLRWNVCA